MKGLLFWQKKTRPEPTTPPHLESTEAEAAIEKSKAAETEGRVDLDEIRARRSRLDRIRRENHFAPAIYDAFKGKS